MSKTSCALSRVPERSTLIPLVPDAHVPPHSDPDPSAVYTSTATTSGRATAIAPTLHSTLPPLPVLLIPDDEKGRQRKHEQDQLIQLRQLLALRHQELSVLRRAQEARRGPTHPIEVEETGRPGTVEELQAFVWHQIDVNGEQYSKPPFLPELWAFLGMCDYYRKFVLNFFEIAHPLFNLASAKVQLKWEEPQEKAFETLKNAITRTLRIGATRHRGS
ncbi:unnamed protein product [Heligmosomoides polygyrus]|uniref:RT_RNaseH_2 domain-containing protein n=1 Tax=Heligmosomoides polygyrus TaxID=6339 RepID=A0A183GVW9_HELPZ|nr:unnamed protein product [Heligmosomoides polygyrus]